MNFVVNKKGFKTGVGCCFQFVLNQYSGYNAPMIYVSGEIANCAISEDLNVPLDEVFVD
jgi:hypothetical protein